MPERGAAVRGAVVRRCAVRRSAVRRSAYPCQESRGGVSVRRALSLSSAEIDAQIQAAKTSGGTPDGYTSITCTRGSISDSCAFASVHRSGWGGGCSFLFVCLFSVGERQRGLIPIANSPLTD